VRDATKEEIDEAQKSEAKAKAAAKKAEKKADEVEKKALKDEKSAKDKLKEAEKRATVAEEKAKTAEADSEQLKKTASEYEAKQKAKDEEVVEEDFSFDKDYKKIIEGKEGEFLVACSDAVQPLTCTYVKPGSIIVSVKGTKKDMKKVYGKIMHDGLTVTSFGFLGPGKMITKEEENNIKAIIASPQQFEIPAWFLNRQRDHKTGQTKQVVSNILDSKLREDLERMKKIRLHRGLRHYWNLKVRGQHTCTTGRRARTVGGKSGH